MAFEWSYSTVSNVIDSWERIRKIENYEQVVGIQLLQKFLTLQPNAKQALGFPKNLDATTSLQTTEEIPKTIYIDGPQTMEDNSRLAKQSADFVKFFLHLIGTVVDMLGPDMDIFESILLDLGQRNVRYGVQPEFYVSLGQALMEVLSENLTPEEFSPKVKADWVEVYAGVSHIIIAGHNQSLKESS